MKLRLGQCVSTVVSHRKLLAQPNTKNESTRHTLQIENLDKRFVNSGARGSRERDKATKPAAE